MCGRFYVDESMAMEIRKILHNIDLKLNGHREVFPTDASPIIKAESASMILDDLTWGFKHYDPGKKSVLINARAETVLDRKMFRDSVMNRRCVIPTSGFYEWDKNKSKIAFMHEQSDVLYLAGFWKDDRFIILTTAANDSIADIHDRMPLTLEPNEVENWLLDSDAYQIMLRKPPGMLKRDMVHQEPEQLSFSWE